MVAFSEQRALETLRQYGARDKVFQFAEWREACGIEGSDKRNRNKLWNVLRRYLTAGVIEEVPTNRSRHRYYKVAKFGQLNRDMIAEQTGSSTPSPSSNGGQAEQKDGSQPSGPSGPARLARIENQVGQSAEDIVKLNAKVATLSDRVEEMSQQLDRLIAMWS